jgi:hypothetical protein
MDCLKQVRLALGVLPLQNEQAIRQSQLEPGVVSEIRERNSVQMHLAIEKQRTKAWRSPSSFSITR